MDVVEPLARSGPRMHGTHASEGTQRSEPATTGWWVVLGAGSVLVAAQWLVEAGRWAALLMPAASTGAALAVWVGLRRRRPARRGPWLWVVAFLALTATADHWLAAYTWLWQREPPVVGGTDALYLAGLLALSVALWRFSARAMPRHDADRLLDMATVAIVATFLAWQVIVAPTVTDASLSVLARVVLSAYPVTDVVLLTMLVGLLGRGLRAVPSVLLVAALCSWLVADSCFLIFSQLSASGLWAAAIPNCAWAAGELCFALAALHPQMTRLTEPAAEPTASLLRPRRLALAMAAFAVPVATDAAYKLGGRELNSLVVFAATACLGVLAVLRSVLLLRRRDRAERLVARREAYFHSVATSSADATLVLDAGGRVVGAVGEVSTVVRFDGDPIDGFWNCIHPDDRVEARATIEKASLVPARPFETDLRAWSPDGTPIWITARVVNLCDHAEVGGYVVNIQDVTRRKTAEEQLTHRAFHDGLTELPNRTLFRDRLEHALQRSTRSGAALAVLFIDLDGFKNVNDSLGHDTGDQLLRVVARRFADSVRTADTVARLGGDEFAILVEDHLHAEDQAIAVAERVLQTLQDPIDIAGTPVAIRASIGIAAGGVGIDAPTLLRNADIAMYHAKSAGKGRYVVYETTMATAVTERLQIESGLFGALDRHELTVVYQPVVHLGDGRLAGFEALVRWHHPQLGDIEPERFIPIAEDNGLIVHIGRYVLETACAAATRWHDRYPDAERFTMAVNVSGRELSAPDFVPRVADVIERTGIDPVLLVLEITETVLIDDADATAARLADLRRLGLRIAVDDFGTGYSSLTYLRQFPVDILKIDRSFVNTMRDHEQLPAILRGLLDLGATLELETIAEGVELGYQRDQLREVNCDLAQGYLFARPLRAADAERFIRQRAVPEVRWGVRQSRRPWSRARPRPGRRGLPHFSERRSTLLDGS